ncbi:MAG: ABC transporter substrate-binding protein [Candidatus Competibacteraceae bacterium]|nr:ABC transporter substrate-binding protein [Candidatus Competibacteraceae bacterium]
MKKSSRTKGWLAASTLAAAMAWLPSTSAIAAEFKVLVVMSYEEDNPWVQEIREGIEGVLSPSSEIRYFYMNTKADRANGPKRAEEAYALFQQFRPDGVIAADDDAQAMFVAPFLKDKSDKPVMFNGVNTEPEKYGFPSRNVSGVLERAHVQESLSFIKQLLPSIQNICFLTNNVPSGQALRAQVMRERDSYPVTLSDFHLVSTTRELAALKKSLNASCDALFIDSLEGITDQSGKSLTNLEISKLLKDIYRGPMLAGNRYQVEQGALAAVVKTGQEQGEKSAEMLLQAMRGKSVAAIPIMKNVQGQRIINVTELERRGVVLKPMALRGATLVREQP